MNLGPMYRVGVLRGLRERFNNTRQGYDHIVHSGNMVNLELAGYFLTNLIGCLAL